MMDASTKGTILELRAVEWLLSHGFKVWRAVDGAQTGDLIMSSSLGPLEVEVRAGGPRKTRPGVYFRQLPQDTADLYLVLRMEEPDRIYWRIAPEGAAKRTLLQAYPVVNSCAECCTRKVHE